MYTTVRANKFNSVLTQKIKDIAASTGFPDAHIPDLVAATTAGTDSALRKVPGITTDMMDAVKLANKQSNVQAFKLVYLVAIAFGGAAIICSVFTKSISKEAKTSQRAVYLETEGSNEKIQAA